LKGKIKRLIRDRGFGFISAENEAEVFFHRSALQSIEFDTLNEGDEVEFDLEKDRRGDRAANVTVITA